MAEKYRIVFDTSFVHAGNKGYIFPNIDKVVGFFEKNKDKIGECLFFMPEAVFEERLSQVFLLFTNTLDKATKFLGESELIEEIGLKNYKDIDYKKIISEKAIKILNENNIKLLEFPDIKPSEIFQRCTEQLKPFRSNKDGSEKDNGFKDTVIWISLLNDAEKNKDSNYVFCAKDGDFNGIEKEFRGKNIKELLILKSYDEIENYFDERFALGLGIKKRDEGIKNGILSNSSYILREFKNSIHLESDYGCLICWKDICPDWDKLEISDVSILRVDSIKKEELKVFFSIKISDGAGHYMEDANIIYEEASKKIIEVEFANNFRFEK